MSDENATIEKPSSQKLPLKTLNTEEAKDQKNFFLRDIDMSFVKEALLKEIDIPKLKESLINDVKTALLKDIDISEIKEALSKDIAVQDLSSGEHKERNVKATKATPATEIRTKKKAVNLPGYKYGLVDSFVKDHQEILSIYEKIMGGARDKDYAILPLMLSQFSNKCFNHFNEEEQLYTFMKALAGSRSEIERRVATEFSVEMKNLSLELFTILNQSNFIPVNDSSIAGFLDEFCQLGAILQERISREETILYPMYEGSRQVVDIC
jgi:hypothetical protein